MKNRNLNLAIIPVLFGFFIMGFADIVGISANYVKKDFGLSDTLTNLLPMMVFLWFAVFSVPTGMIMNSFGRKKTVLVSLFITMLALLLPLVVYKFTAILIAFALLGIGNTIMQVSLNPLLTNVVNNEKLSSSLTLGQFIKAIASFSGPILAGFASGTLGNWKLIFPLFATVTILSMLWLAFTPVTEEKARGESLGYSKIFGLLKDPNILMIFLAIIFLVGIDVGLNITLPGFLMSRTALPLEKAGWATSLYFAARTAGTFAGAFLLMKISGRKIYLVSIILGVSSMLSMIFLTELYAILTMIFCLGLAIANIFPILFSIALQKEPERANEISGLLIMGVAGGAIVPPIMGKVSDSFGQTGAMLVLLVAFGYLLFNAIRMQKQ